MSCCGERAGRQVEKTRPQVKTYVMAPKRDGDYSRLGVIQSRRVLGAPLPSQKERITQAEGTVIQMGRNAHR